MAIQNRRGVYGDFRPEKMVSGEMAVVLSGDPASASGRSVYICFEPGHVKRITTYEDFENELRAATEELQEAFTDDIRNAISAAVTATAAANAAVEAANAATEAANAAAEAAGAYVLGDISGKTVTFTEAVERANIESEESTATIFGKIKKWFSDLKDAAFAAIANDLATTTAGSVLDARVGPVIAMGFDNIQTQLTELNGKLPRITSSTDTILNICKGQSAGSIGYYTYNGSLIPSDYPSRLLDAGAHYQPIMIVYKTATSISTILIYDVVNTSGYPRGIQGYCNGSRLFWGDIF